MSTTVQTHNDQARCQSNLTTVETDAHVVVEFLPSTERESVMGWWKQLENDLGEVSLASSAAWTETWLEHYGDLVQHRFVVGRVNSTICGLTLLTEGVDQKVGPFRLKTLHVGTAGEPDQDSVCVEYNQVLAVPEHRTAFAQAVMNKIFQESNWDELRLEGFLNDHVDAFVQEREPTETRTISSYYFDLKAARENEVTAVSCLGSATRKNIRKNIKAYGALEPEWADNTRQAEDIFDEMVELHQARWQAVGEPGSYASQRFNDFHRDLLHKIFPTRQMGLFRLKSEGETLGCVQFFVEHNRALVYQAGSAMYQSGRKSPGMMVDVNCIEQCLEKGFDSYDFLGGDSEHKRKLTTDSNQLCWVTYRRFRWKFVFVSILRSLRDFVKRPFKKKGK